jgi:hypothetical protein
MGILVGGEKAWKVRRHGDIVCSYQWANDEPAMLLFPAMPGLGAGTYVLALSAAYKYLDSQTGGPTMYLIRQADVAAEVMGMIPTTGTLRKIADVIADGMLDLIEMPPEPDSHKDTKPQGEGVIKIDGQVVAECGA